MPKNFQKDISTPQQKTGANSKVTKTAKDKLNVRKKRVPINTRKKKEKKASSQVARKRTRLATKVKDQKIFRTKM